MFDPSTRRWYPDWYGQQPQDDPQYVAWARQQPAQLPQTPAPAMTPTIHAEMIEVTSIAEAEAYQMTPGASQMFYTKDHAHFVVKEQGQGGYNLMIYDRRPPEPPRPALDPSQYVTWEALEAYINGQRQPAKPQGGAE